MAGKSSEDILYCPICNNELDLIPNTEISKHKEDVKSIVLFCKQCKKNIPNDKAKVSPN